MKKRFVDRIRCGRDWMKAAYVDLRLFVTGKSDPELPPLRMQFFVGAGDFRSIGDEMARLLASVGGLRRTDRVLDVGCGIGRVAIPLTRYLDPSSSYHGFDIVSRGIRWCQRRISPRHPHFHFHHVRVRNPEYRQRGAPAAEFRFPFESKSFDFVFATSLYTHLNPPDMHRYLSESQRMLAPGGTFFGTFYLLDDFARAHMTDRAPYDFPLIDGVVRRMAAGSSTAGVAYEESYVVEALAAAGFIDVRIHHGQWSGRDGTTWQDIVVARPARPAASVGKASAFLSASSLPFCRADS